MNWPFCQVDDGFSQKLEETLDRCVRPLQRDPELALDARRGLAGQLKKHLAEGASEEEALRRLGSPDEVGAELLQANCARLKRRAKLRRIVMLLAFPAVIAALLFSINFRFWYGAKLVMEPYLDSRESSHPVMRGFHAIASLLGRSWRHYSRAENILLHGDRSRGATAEMRAEIHAQYAVMELDPSSKVFRANAVLALLADAGMDNRTFQIAEVEKARAFEPENALYDYLLAALLLEDALEFPATETESFQIKDRASLDRAMAVFRTGLGKPYCRTYIREMAERRHAILNKGGKDFASAIERVICDSEIRLPNLNLYRTLGRTLPFYGELQIAQGDRAAGEEFLDAWKPFVRHIAEEENTLIGLLVAGAVADCQSRFARTPVPEARQREIAQACAPIRELRAENQKRGSEQPRYWRGLGILGLMLLPAAPLEICPPEMFTSERRLDYVFASGAMLLFLNVLGCLILCGCAAGMLISHLRKQPGFLLTFSRRDAIQIGVWGVLVPVALFFALAELTPLGGRGIGLTSLNPGAFRRLALEAFCFVFLLPLPFLLLWRRACRKRGREIGLPKLPSAVRQCNLFLGCAVLLVCFTALIRPGLIFAERYWSDREQLIIHAEFFTRSEDLLVKEYRGKLLTALPK